MAPPHLTLSQIGAITGALNPLMMMTMGFAARDESAASPSTCFLDLSVQYTYVRPQASHPHFRHLSPFQGLAILVGGTSSVSSPTTLLHFKLQYLFRTLHFPLDAVVEVIH